MPKHHGCRRHESSSSSKHCKSSSSSSKHCKSSSSSSCGSSSKSHHHHHHHKKHKKHRKHRRHHKSSCSRSEERSPPCEVVQCGRVVTTLNFSATIRNLAACTPAFLLDGFIGADLSNGLAILGKPGTQEDILTGNGFPYEQVVPADTNCATVTYHIQQCQLRQCESYVLTIARVNQCGPGLCLPGNSKGTFSLTPLVNIPFKTAKGQDLCGRDSATFALLAAAQTVACPLRAGDVVTCYFTIIPNTPTCDVPCVQCVADGPSDQELGVFAGPGGLLASITFS